MDVSPDTIYPILAALIFAGFAVVTLFGAIVAATARRLMRSVSGLALSFVGLAGLYYYLHSPFLALMQILIYVGAICVTIMFAMMLTELHEEPRSLVQTVLTGVLCLIVAGAVATPLVLLAVTGHWLPAPAAQINPGTVQDLGRALLTRFGLAFELSSAVLLVAIVGALVVARSGRRTNS